MFYYDNKNNTGLTNKILLLSALLQPHTIFYRVILLERSCSSGYNLNICKSVMAIASTINSNEQADAGLQDI